MLSILVPMFAGTQMGAMFLTADGAVQDEKIGYLPQLPLPVGPNQYTPVTLLTLAPPLYAAQVIRQLSTFT